MLQACCTALTEDRSSSRADTDQYRTNWRGQARRNTVRRVQIIDLVGWAAGILTMLTTAPQLVKLLRTGDTRGVALGTYGVWVSTATWWAVWSFQVQAWPSFVMNTISIVLELLIVVRLRPTIRQWVLILLGAASVLLLTPWPNVVLLGAMCLQLWVALPTARLVLIRAPLDGVSAATWATVLSSNVLWVVYMTGIGRPEATPVDFIAGICALIILYRLRRVRRYASNPENQRTTPTA